MTIDHCERSTLLEAWAGVVGLPGPLSLGSAQAVSTLARRRFDDLEMETIGQLLPAHASVLATPASDATPPVWFHQASWGGHRWAGRWGHRVLSLHRLISQDERYETFTQTMLPTLVQWFDLGREAFEFAGDISTVATVIFGTTNRFTFAPEDGDLSEWFRFNYGLDAAGIDRGLERLDLGARIARPDLSSRASIRLEAEAADPDGVDVLVHTVVERDLPAEVSFSQTERLLAEIDVARMVASETFFSFVTDRTLERMGAVHVPSA
jgi:hypothetical protein